MITTYPEFYFVNSMHYRRPAMKDGFPAHESWVAQLTNLRISEEKPFVARVPYVCNSTAPVAVRTQCRQRAATDSVAVAAANTSPYFKRTTSFRMVLNLFYFNPFFYSLFNMSATWRCVRSYVGTQVDWFNTSTCIGDSLA